LNIASGAVSAAGTINVPAIQKPYIVINGSSFAVTVKVSGLTGVSVPPGKRTVVYNDGTDVGEQISFLSSLTLLTALPVASGGTGLTSTPANGQLDIGNGTGFTRATLTAGSGITVTNSAGGITIASTVTPGTGTVTSVAGAGAINGLTLTGTVTTSGNITLGGTFRKNMVVIGTNTAAAANSMYVLTASLTLTLPASPSAGDFVDVSNMSGAITAVIARNGKPIMALAEDLTVDLDGAGFTLVYADATRGWVLLP
jgi:hypothetical protein